jgi:hypothetical protein
MAEAQSILAADFGSVYTRVLLLDVVGGAYQVVARSVVRSTGDFPAGDVTLGLRQATARIANVTGRTLLDNQGNIITPENETRTGVDLFVATASGGRPLRAVLIGLMHDVSIESGIRATEGTYVNVEEIISLREARDEEEQLNAILLTRPNILIVTGGTEGGAVTPLRKMLKLVRTALSAASSDSRPALLYAGNSALAEEVAADFEALTRVYIAENVRPTLDVESLEDAQNKLGRAFDQYKEAQGAGFDKVSEMSAMGLLPTARSYSIVAEYLGKARASTYASSVVVDVGSATATLATYRDGAAKTTIRTDIGLGTTAPDMVTHLNIDAIRRWIPYSIAKADVMNYALNKRLRPSTVPMTRNQMYIEQALLRAGLENMVKAQYPDWADGVSDADVVIVSGSALTNTGNPGMAAILTLDGLQPAGTTVLYADPNGVMGTLGPLAFIAPEAVVQLLDGSSLERLGTVFAVEGKPNTRRGAIRYTIDFDDGERLTDVLDGGLFQVIDLPLGKSAEVRVQALSGLTINGRRRARVRVEGGTAGIILDARGRPLPLALNLHDRMIQICAWMTLATDFYHEGYEDEDLAPVNEREPLAPFVMGGMMATELANREEDTSVTDLLEASDTELNELESLFGDEEDRLR